jgi:probable F420-dependent oxidoreductase
MAKTFGPVGFSMPVSFTSTPRADEQLAAVRRLERAGYTAGWTNEVIGKDALAQVGALLAATGRMTLGTCVANIWARAPQTAHGAATFLAQAYPDRFVLGLGVGYPQQAQSVGREFGKPLAAMGDYLTAMGTRDYPLILAANGPKMLGLAASLADGALPAGLPPAYTALARRLLGPDKLLVVAQSVVIDDSLDRARATAERVVATWAARESFRTVLAQVGASPSADLVAYTGPDSIAGKVGEHLAAGADHVVLLQPLGTEFAPGIDGWERVAPALKWLE